MSGQHTIFRRLRALSERLREFVEALGLEKPPLPIAALHRRICKIAGERRENIPTYKAVYRIVRGLPKDLLTRAMKERRPYGDVL